MRPVKRGYVDKATSAKRFRHHVSKSKSPNMIVAPMRGGWRL